MLIYERMYDDTGSELRCSFSPSMMAFGLDVAKGLEWQFTRRM